MDSDEDICVLQYSDEDIEVDAGAHPVFPFSPFAPAPVATGQDYHGSHDALKTAFLTLQQKLNESKAQNQQLAQRVRDLEAWKTRDLDSFVQIGESFDMMEDARYVTEGGAGKQPTGDLLVGPGEGYANNMRRQEKTPEKNQALSSLNQQVAALRQENSRLQQGWEVERREREAAQQSLRNLQERCSSLQIERDRAVKEGTSLHASLQKANQEMSLLKEFRGESMSGEPPPELLNEVLHLRKVIDKLKTMVLMQKECLVSQSMSVSMRSSLNRPPRDSPSMEPQSAPQGGSGSHSGHSWEMVNGTACLSAESRHLQQRSAKMPSANHSPRRDISMNPPSSGHATGNAGKPSHQNGASPKNQSGPLSGPQSGAGQRPRGEGIIRRHSEVNVQEPKMDMTRAHTLPQQTPPRLADWMSTHYQQKQQQQGRGGDVILQPGAVGLNQFMKDTPTPTPAPGKMESGQIVSSPSRHVQAQYPPYYPQRQLSPMRQPESTYDNIAYTSAATTNTSGTIVPSMTILNQSSMTGARVLQSSSGNLRSGGATTTPSIQEPGVPVSVGRDSAPTRASPQEHSDMTQPHNPTDLELNQQIRFVNEPVTPEAGANLDRKCPVCCQDFSHITMDEFQTHVFECFDDADDTSNAPETLQAQQGQRAPSQDRVCPMCERSFTDSISQDFFESHVQSHFEDVVDHFELLDLHRT